MKANKFKKIANEKNKEVCKKYLDIIEDASKKGEYEIEIDDMPANHKRYLGTLGFNVNSTLGGKFKINW
jgi:hypothetical protein